MQQPPCIIATEEDILSETAEQLWTLQSYNAWRLRDFLLLMGINLTGIVVSKRSRDTLLQLSEQCVYDWRNQSLRTLAVLRKEENNGSRQTEGREGRASSEEETIRCYEGQVR